MAGTSQPNRSGQQPRLPVRRHMPSHGTSQYSSCCSKKSTYGTGILLSTVHGNFAAQSSLDAQRMRGVATIHGAVHEIFAARSGIHPAQRCILAHSQAAGRCPICAEHMRTRRIELTLLILQVLDHFVSKLLQV